MDLRRMLAKVGAALVLASVAFFATPAPVSGDLRSSVSLGIASAAADPERIPSTGKFVIPANTGPVTDKAGILGANEKTALADKMRRYKAATGHEIAILVVPSLQEQPIEDVAFVVARTWTLGDEKRDDGVLLMWSVEDRKVRIEAGRGAEGDIPDATAFGIIDKKITPFFKESRWYDGLNAGLDGIMAEMGGAASGSTTSDNDAGIIQATRRTRTASTPTTAAPAAPRLRDLLGAGAFGLLFLLVAVWRIRSVGFLGFLSELFFFLSVFGRGGGGRGGGGGSRRDDDRWGGGGGGFGGGGASGDY